MAFYAQNPFYQRRQAQASPYASPFGIPYATAPAHSPAPSFNFYTGPSSSPADLGIESEYGYDDFEAEERAALAHLRSIQQRREAAQLAARREAAIQARAAAEREAAIKVALERQRQVEAQRKREEAIRQHLIAAAAAEQSRREDAYRRAIAAEQHRREAVQQAIAAEQHRRAIAAAHQRQIAQRAAAVEQNDRVERAQAQEGFKRRDACARRCAGGCAKKEEVKDDNETNWDDFNKLISSMFGFDLAEAGQTEKKEEDKKAAKAPTPASASAPASTSAPATTPKVDTSRAATPKPANKPQAAETKDHRSEIDINDLISSFLGYNVTPATADDKPTAGSEEVTNNLNKFLNQFGLEFEAIKNGESSSSASASTPAPAPAPASASTSTPAAASAATPSATKPEPVVEGKGKGVAEGEKPNRADDNAAALNKLRDISHELHLATESFTFPAHLSFADTTSPSEATPALLFNKTNSGYHAQAHKLLQLLLAADGISSGGDREVRKQRKAIVKAIEGAIERLEQKRDQAWAEVREKRERGEESDDEGSVSSWNSTEPEHIEHAEQPKSKEETAATEPEAATTNTTYAQVAATDAPSEDNKAEEAKGFDVPESADTATATETPQPAEITDASAVTDNESKAPEGKEKETQKKTEKEDGYELL